VDTCESMDFKKQRPDSPFFFEKEQVISLLRLTTSIYGVTIVVNLVGAFG